MAFKEIMGLRVISFLGALGTGLQNYMGVASFIQGMMSLSYAATEAGRGIIHGVATMLGGFCSTLVNYCMNIGLLEDFYERITKKPKPKNLKGWKKFRYYAGAGVFIGTGILFGLTAIAFGPIGPLAVISIIAGIFVSIIMIIQEVETWLKSFDNEADIRKPLSQIFKEWKNSLTQGKVVGLTISIGNVIALSLLFTIGLSTFFMSVGVAALPALITSFAIAFTGGAFTEFYFYHSFLSKFCDEFKKNWKEFKKVPYPVLGFACVATNALVNGILAYTGIFMLSSLFAAASVAAPPLGILIAVAVVTGLFAGSASFILGLDFWKDNSKKLKKFFSGYRKNVNKEAPTENNEAKQDSINTADIMINLPTLKEAASQKGHRLTQPAPLRVNETKLHSLHFTPKKPIKTPRPIPAIYPSWKLNEVRM